jgi:PAS domain S-box-containing protein
MDMYWYRCQLVIYNIELDEVGSVMTRNLTYDELMNEYENLQRQVRAYKDAPDTLDRSEEKHRTILDTMGVGYVELDLSGKFTFVNEAEAKMLGYPREELSGLDYHQFTSEQTSRVLYEFFHRVYKTGEPEHLMEYEIIMKDGGKRIHEMSTTLIRNDSGRAVGFRGVSRDITERKLAEKALQESYALLKSVVESPKEVVIFALDRHYRYIAFNKNHQRTMKHIWGVDITLGNSMLEYIKDPEDCLKAKYNFDRTLSGESFTLVEAYGDTALERRYYEDIYNPILDGNGNVIGLTLFLTDITERRLAALEREQLIAELQQALADVKTLSGMLPICSNCKKIRDDKGYWDQIESYISKYSDAVFSHSICPECAKKLYPDLID